MGSLTPGPSPNLERGAGLVLLGTNTVEKNPLFLEPDEKFAQMLGNMLSYH
jgi:hypothetical protein